MIAISCQLYHISSYCISYLYPHKHYINHIWSYMRKNQFSLGDKNDIKRHSSTVFDKNKRTSSMTKCLSRRSGSRTSSVHFGCEAFDRKWSHCFGELVHSFMIYLIGNYIYNYIYMVWWETILYSNQFVRLFHTFFVAQKTSLKSDISHLPVAGVIPFITVTLW
jgi:hypothetical protein